MKVLAFESSTKVGSVALIENGVCTFSRSSHVQKSHSEVLHQFAFEILEEAKLGLKDIDVFAAGNGPGSFTGIRVSLNTAKAFAYSFQKKIVAVDSLQNLAFLNQGLGSPILCLINAYKNMSYYGLYDSPTKVLKNPSVIPMKDIDSILQVPFVTVGDGYVTYEKFLPLTIKKKMLRPPHLIDEPSAESLGLLAYAQAKTGLTLDWKSTQPLYIRASEAEENKRGIVWSALDFKE